MYLNDVKSGTTNGNAEPCVIKENVATAFVDGCNALGELNLEFSLQQHKLKWNQSWLFEINKNLSFVYIKVNVCVFVGNRWMSKPLIRLQRDFHKNVVRRPAMVHTIFSKKSDISLAICSPIIVFPNWFALKDDIYDLRNY